MIQATKNKAKSCSVLDAIQRCSCSADWLKLDGRENPVSVLETGRYAVVRFAAPSSSHLHVESLLFLLGSLRKPLKTKFMPAVSSVYSLTHSLSLSLRVSTFEKKNHIRSAQPVIQGKVGKASVKFLSPLDFAFNMWKSNCALDDDSAGVTDVGSRTKLGVPTLTGPLHRGIHR